MSELDVCYRKDPNSVVSRVIAGEVIIVPIHKNVGNLDSLFTLNDTAARAWELTNGQLTLREIRDQMVTEFAQDAETIAQDLLELFAQLESLNLVGKVPE